MRNIVWFLILIIFYSCDESKIEYDCDYCTEKNVFCLNSENPTLFADGKSVTDIEVCFPMNLSSSITSVIFEVPVEAGDFSIDGGTNTIKKDLELNKKTHVKFKSGIKPGKYNLTAKVTLNNVDYKETILLDIKPIESELFQMSFNKSLLNLTADNFTQFKATLKINNFDLKDSKIFCKLYGPIKFLNNDSILITRSLSQNKEVEFYFQTKNEIGEAKIQINYGEFTFDTSFIIFHSYPEKIKLVSKIDSIGIKDSLKIDLYFTKASHGNASLGIPIEIKAIQLLNGKVLNYSNSLPPAFYSSSTELNRPILTFSYFSPQSAIWNKNEDLLLVCKIPNTELSDTISFKIK